MIDTSGTPPRQVRVATALLWSVVPYGLAVTVLNGVALVMTDRRLPQAPVTMNADAVPVALREFAGFAWGRTALIALFFAVAAVASGLLARAARRGVRRRSGRIPLFAGLLAIPYTIGLALAGGLNPVLAYQSRLFRVGDGSLAAGAPFDMAAAAPSWYLLPLAALLATGWACQLAGMILLTRPATVGWYAGQETAAPARQPRTVLTAALGPVFVAVIAAYNQAAIWLTENAADRAASVGSVASVADSARHAALIQSALLGVPAVALAILRVHPLLWTRPAALFASGVLTVLYLLALTPAQLANPLSTGVLPDDQSGFSEHIPPWYLPALTVIQVLAALTQLAALAERSRGSLTRPG
ncbi:hypothetical protein ACFYSC_06370 [Streptosporangium sp. NPDC004379]|uniref:hypothetical protein n=1 Tax=Streptosporangium sp. NPDC004379 TaxID=3366189 RepID=UPI0036CE2269